MADTDHSHLVNTGRTELTLDQLGMMQPGVARLMLEVSARFSRGYHAAQAKNIQLARFQLGEGTKLLRQCATVQPRFADSIKSFLEDHVAVLRSDLEESDWSGFEEHWKAMTSAVNEAHTIFDHGFIVWKVSDVPPSDIVLAPLEESS